MSFIDFYLISYLTLKDNFPPAPIPNVSQLVYVLRAITWVFAASSLVKISSRCLTYVLKKTCGHADRVFFFYACSGQRQFSTVSFSGFGLWVKVLGSVYHNRFPNSNPNLIHNSSRNLPLTQILTLTQTVILD